MADGKRDDDRSMGEILASIRKIVSDEETTRKVAEDERRKEEVASGAGVLVLSGDMRAAQAGGGAAGASAADADASSAAAPLDLASAAKQVSLGDPAAAQAAKPKVDFEATPGLSEAEVEEIVRRVVREELQGPIGQQISRKVKALIAQEIAKAIGQDESLI